MLESLGLFEKILWISFLLMFATQLFYYFFFYLRLLINKPKSVSNNFPPVSVIICARNEENNLKNNLPAILNQDYPDFEVIVVNDGSLDNTDEVLLELKKHHNNLRTTRIAEEQQFDMGKKLAVTVGVKAAKYEVLLFIDADCKPASNSWIKTMVSEYENDVEIVLGYGQYQMHKSFLNALIRFDTLSIAMNYLSMAMAGVPYMGVGRNLSYKKTLFFKNKGFANHYHLLSGDDDLLINETATKKNTRVALSKESFTVSEPKKQYRAWVKQKKRHLTTGKYYKWKHRFLLGLEPFSKFLFYISFVLLLFNSELLIEVLSVFLIRLILYLIIFKLEMRRMNEKYLLLFSPIFELFLPIFYIFILYSNKLTGKTGKWK